MRDCVKDDSIKHFYGYRNTIYYYRADKNLTPDCLKESALDFDLSAANSHDDEIMIMLANGRTLTTKSIAKVLERTSPNSAYGFGMNTAAKVCNRMEKRGLIVRTAIGDEVAWRVA